MLFSPEFFKYSVHFQAHFIFRADYQNRFSEPFSEPFGSFAVPFGKLQFGNIDLFVMDIDDSLLSLFCQEFGKNAMIPVRQGTATLSAPMKDLKAEFGGGNIVYDANPIDRWCFANTYVR